MAALWASAGPLVDAADDAGSAGRARVRALAAAGDAAARDAVAQAQALDVIVPEQVTLGGVHRAFESSLVAALAAVEAWTG